jgi:hypothetical protein
MMSRGRKLEVDCFHLEYVVELQGCHGPVLDQPKVDKLHLGQEGPQDQIFVVAFPQPQEYPHYLRINQIKYLGPKEVGLEAVLPEQE